MKRIETSILIHADIHLVWDVMVGTHQYAEWNPFIPAVQASETPPKVGTDMLFTVRWKNGATRNTTEVVDVWSPPQEHNGEWQATWRYFFKSYLSTVGLVRAARTQVLSSSQSGLTAYHSFEDFHGWGLLFLPVAKVQDGFERQALALKKHCEQLQLLG